MSELTTQKIIEIHNEIIEKYGGQGSVQHANLACYIEIYSFNPFQSQWTISIYAIIIITCWSPKYWKY